MFIYRVFLPYLLPLSSFISLLKYPSLLAWISPGKTWGKSDFSANSRIEEQIAFRSNFEEFLTGPIPIATLKSVVDLSLDFAAKYGAQGGSWTSQVPFLINQGTGDRTCDLQGALQFFALAGARNKLSKLCTYENGFHDLNHDLDCISVMRNSCDWLESVLNDPAAAGKSEKIL